MNAAVAVRVAAPTTVLGTSSFQEIFRGENVLALLPWDLIGPHKSDIQGQSSEASKHEQMAPVYIELGLRTMWEARVVSL